MCILFMVMHSSHVIVEVVPPWETIAGLAAITTGVKAKMWPVTMAVHAVRFTLVTEQAGCGRELLLGAGLNLATEWLQVRVNELAVHTYQSAPRSQEDDMRDIGSYS